MGTKVSKAVRKIISTLSDESSPKQMSKAEYKEVLEGVLEEVESRLEIVSDELKREEDES